MHNRMQPVHHLLVADLDGQLAPAVETSRRQIDGADDGPHAVGKQQLGVQLQSLQLVYLDPHVIHDAHAAHRLH